MKQLYDQNGDVYLNDRHGIPTLVASIKNGCTFNLIRSSPKPITKVTIYTMSLMDEFYFCADRPMYHFLQTRGLMPKLTACFLTFFSQEESYNAEFFLQYIVDRYFKDLGFTIPGEEPKANIPS